MALKNTYQARKRFTKTPVKSTGMWYQEEDVVVPSNQITMKGPQGQPDYFKKPILGIGMQSGQQQVMQPGQEYLFPNDQSVYETRMQNGGETSTSQNPTKISSVNVKGTMPKVNWYESIDPRNWGLRDYSAVDDYGTAFNRARQAGQNKFYWKGERFNTAQEGEDRSQALFSLSQEERNKIFNSVNPEGYPGSELFPAIKRYVTNSSFKDEKPNELREIVDEDAWAFFMGVPQEQNSITKSNYKPSNSKDKVKNYYTIRNAYPDFEEILLKDANEMFSRKGREDVFTDSKLDLSNEDVYGVLSKDSSKVTGRTSFYPLENATYSKGEDEKGKYISVYDVYDFDVPYQEKIGLPYEVYDRIYYNEGIDGKLVPKNQNGNRLSKYQEGGYTISPGDTFFGIANKFGVTRKEMIGSNPDVNFEKIKAGQRLRVPETFDTAQGYPTGYFETMTPATFDAMGKPIPQVAPKPKVTPQPTSNVQLGPDIFLRQAFAESTFNPNAKSPAGYMGLAQIGNDVIADYRKATGAAKVDPYNPADNAKVQQWAMNQIYNSEFVNKENQDPSVRLAKTLASYNWGKGNVRNYLTKQKKKGVDIYNSMDWVEGLPKETRDYIHKIQVGDMNDFEKQFNQAKSNKKYSPYINLYKKKNGGLQTSYNKRNKFKK